MPAFDEHRRQRTVLLTTRKRDGTTVSTPVHIALGADGSAYVRRWPGLWAASGLSAVLQGRMIRRSRRPWAPGA
jgi:hypothetical protein